MTYLERYQAGEYEAVWAELLRLGDAVRQDPLYSDALAVAQETMRRVRHNVERLHRRLLALDYRFVEPRRALVPPQADIYDKLARFEAEFGTLPLSLRAWFEWVGRVDFRGDHPALCGYDLLPGDFPYGEFFPHNPGVSFPYYADPLRFWDIDEATSVLEDRPGVPIESTPPHQLVEADWYTKAGVSGGQYVILLPNPAVDAPLGGGPRGSTFVGYLRTAFRWGGFPGYELHSSPAFAAWRERYLIKAEYPGIPVPTQLLRELADGLLPI